GVDPIKYMEKLGDRCDLIHQKDLPSSVSPVNIFEIIDPEETIDMNLMVESLDVEDFTEIGKGVMDVQGIVEAFKQNPHAKYIFIEQDWTTMNQIDSVEMSYNYLSEILK